MRELDSGAGQRTAVWSEPEMVEAGAYEFADTEKFVAIGEEIMTPYPFLPSIVLPLSLVDWSQLSTREPCSEIVLTS